MQATATILDNGDLSLTLDAEGRQELADTRERGEASLLWDMLESYACNGSFTPFDAGQANPFVGLTEAPCIAEAMAVGENGEREIVGRFWYFPAYMVADPLQTLQDTGEVVFRLAPQ